MTTKTEILKRILQVEGGYVNDPNDSGGETNHGITIGKAREWGYEGPMIDLPVDTAMEIYAEDFWHPLSGDELLEISPIICEEIIDTGVNMGIGRAAEFLQKLLNVLNLQGQLYSDIAEDRDLGPQTLKALRTYLTARRRVDGERVLYRMLNSIQGAFYVDLAIRREKDEDFIYGWFKHRVQSWPTET